MGIKQSKKNMRGDKERIFLGICVFGLRESFGASRSGALGNANKN